MCPKKPFGRDLTDCCYPMKSRTLKPLFPPSIIQPKFLPLRGMELITLWDMIQFLADELLALTHTLELHSANAFWKGREDAAKADCEVLLDLLEETGRRCKDLDLIKTGAIVAGFKLQFKSSPPITSYQVIHSHLTSILSSISGELREKTFTFVPAKKAIYFEKDNLFDDGVSKGFGSAVDHIKNAGNCLAADLNTAAAYHLMCIANLGLIGLARRLRVIIKRTPLEYAEWQTMIDKVEKKLKQKTVKPPGNKKGAIPSPPVLSRHFKRC